MKPLRRLNYSPSRRRYWPIFAAVGLSLLAVFFVFKSRSIPEAPSVPQNEGRGREAAQPRRKASPEPGAERESLRAGLENGSTSSTALYEALQAVPDAEKAEFLRNKANAAGKLGNLDFFGELLQLPAGSVKSKALAEFAMSLPPEAALVKNFLGLVTEEATLKEEREAIWQGIAGTIVGLDSLAIRDLLESGSVTPSLRPQTKELLFMSYANTGTLQDATHYLESAPDQESENLMDIYWRQLSALNPESGKLALQENRVGEKSIPAVCQAVANSMIKNSSYEACLPYANSLPDPGMQTAFIRQVFDLWVANDSMAASKAAVNLPPGPQFDAAAEAIALRMERLGDRESAQTWRSAKSR